MSARPALFLAMVVLAGVLASAPAATEPWVLVDTAAGRVEVRDQGTVLTTLRNPAVGRGGVTDLHLRGDQTTPRGEYRVTRIDLSSRFHIFVGLDYPTIDHLALAYTREHIGAPRYRQLRRLAQRRGRLPATTVLGGHIGLHGVGNGDPWIHQRFHWTEGCVALTDSQMRRLLFYIDEGTRVVIR